jgi:PEP-CTERM motif
VRRFFAVLAAPLMLVLGASGAAADPLVIRPDSGTVQITLDFEGDWFRFAGDDFVVNQSKVENVLLFFDRTSAPSCDPCNPGDVFDPSFHTNGEILLGLADARFGSTSYSNVTLFGTLNVDATPVAFPNPGQSFGLRTPFAFNGRLRGVDGGQQLFAADFVGGGTARRFFDPNENTRSYTAGENQQVFLFEDPADPVPEPATLLLFSTGAAIAGAIRRRRTN